MEVGIVSFRITFSLTPFLLRHEDICVRMVVGGDSSDGIDSSGGRSSSSRTFGTIGLVPVDLDDGGGERGDILEDVFRVEEFRINVFWSEKFLANNEDLCGDITLH